MNNDRVSNGFYLVFVLTFVMVVTLTVHPSLIIVYSQTTPTTAMNSTTMQQHAEHIVDNLVISEHIPLKGQLANGDYILLMDLTPFAASIEGHSHIAMKIPCDEDGIAKVTVVTGVAPNLNSLDIGKAINNGTLNGKALDLSAEGKSCLFHAEIPNETTDIALVNTSNETLNFDEDGYHSFTISVHGTALQHLADNETAMSSLT